MSRRASGGSVVTSAMSWPAFWAEVIAGLGRRPGRSALTGLGTVFGVGAFVAVVGLTGTANAQIGATFDERAATQVAIDHVGVQSEVGFPADAEDRVNCLRGVRASGVRAEWRPGARLSRYSARDDLPSATVPVIAVGVGFWEAVGPVRIVGRTFDAFLSVRRVLVLGASAAEGLAIDAASLPAYVYVDGTQFLVIGIAEENAREPAMTGAAYVPLGIAPAVLGRPESTEPASMVVAVDVGAARVVAMQASIALDPYLPERFRPGSVIDPSVVRDQVSQDLRRLFLLLSGVSLLIGALGIANTTLVSVLDSFGEIGIRRALGALPRHVLGQFLAEATVLGGIGGLVGGSIAICLTVGIAHANAWTAVMPGWLVVVAPVIGATTGFVAGIYPASKAARIEPIGAIRRG